MEQGGDRGLGGLDLPSTWWTALHTALATITEIPTDRYTIKQQYFD
ncbi:hypothetical protein [Streptomyces sp. NPDC021212]